MFIQVRILSLSSPRFLQNYHIRFLSQTAKQEICWSEREIFRTRNLDAFQSKMKEPQKFTKLNCPLNQTTRTSQASPLERSATLITSRDVIHPQYAKCLHPPTNQPTNQPGQLPVTPTNLHLHTAWHPTASPFHSLL